MNILKFLILHERRATSWPHVWLNSSLSEHLKTCVGKETHSQESNLTNELMSLKNCLMLKQLQYYDTRSDNWQLSWQPFHILVQQQQSSFFLEDNVFLGAFCIGILLHHQNSLIQKMMGLHCLCRTEDGLKMRLK